MMDDEETKSIMINQYLDAMSDSESDNVQLINEIQEIVDRYKDRVTIAEGGMKQIIASEDLLTDRVVARAVMKEGDSSEYDAFLNEARITAGLEHPNIVPVHDIGVTENGEPYFTMKRLGGRNLQEILEDIFETGSSSQEFPQDRLLEVFLKVCDAVGFAHSKNILHLDLKPSNIQVNEFGEVIVFDWGLARKTDDPHKPSKFIKGSPGYMAPEQISSSGLTVCTDIYSLGAVLYSLLTGHTPVEGNDLDDVLKKTLTGDICPATEKNGAFPVSTGLNSVVMKALSTDAEERYQSVRELAEDVHSIIRGFAPEAEEAGFAKLFLLMIKRHKQICFLILLFFIVLVSVSVVFISHLNIERNAAVEARDDAVVARDDAEKSRGIAEDAFKEAERSRVLAESAEADSMKIRQRTAPSVVNYALKLYGNLEYEKAYKVLFEGLTLNPEFSYGQFYNGMLLLGQHKFKEALTVFEGFSGGKDVSKHIAFTKKCLRHIEEHQGFNGEQAFAFFNVIGKLPGCYNLEWYFLYSFSTKGTVEERMTFTREFLSKFTEETYNLTIEETAGKYSIFLKGNTSLYDIRMLYKLPLSRLDLANTAVSNLRPLEGMELEWLDLSNTRVSDVTFLKNMPLKYLNISDTNISWIKPLEGAPLEKLILNKHWFDIKVLDNLPKLKEITLYRKTFDRSTIEKLSEKFKVTLID